MSDEELAAIEARANAATKGPWFLMEDGFSSRPPNNCPTVYATDEELRYIAFFRDICIAGNPTPNLANAEFTAHARTDIPALLAYVRELRAVVDRPNRLEQDDAAAVKEAAALRTEVEQMRRERDAEFRRAEVAEAENRRLREAALTVMDRVRRAGAQGWSMQQFLNDGSVRELVEALAQPAPAPARYQCERCGGTGVQPQGRHWDGSKYAEMPEQPCQLCGGEGKLGMIPSQPAQQPEPAKDRLREMTDEEADALIERVEDAVGMGKGAWDMTPGRELARSFAAAIAASKGEVQK